MPDLIAARKTDEVTHSLELFGAIAGSLVGAVVGAVILVAGVTEAISGVAGALAAAPETFGLSLLAIPAAVGLGVTSFGTAGMAFSGGGLAGAQFCRGLEEAFGGPWSTGKIESGSPDVFIGDLPAARALVDSANCNGMLGVYHFIMENPLDPNVLIAEGAKKILINDQNAARLKMKLTCGAEIRNGFERVIWGGPTARVLPVAYDDDDVNKFEHFLGSIFKISLGTAFVGSALEGTAGAFLLTFGGLTAVFLGLGKLGKAMGPGWDDILQGGFGLSLVVGGGIRELAKETRPTGAKNIEEGLDPIETRMNELAQQGHGPQRHEGLVTEQQLSDRAMYGLDPMTGTTTDGVTGGGHKYSADATKINSPEDYVRAEDYLRNSNEFSKKTADAEANGEDRIVVENVPLEDIYGPNYEEHVSGKTRVGTKKAPTGTVDTDFTDGTMTGVYQKNPITGNWDLVTMYPNPK